MAAGISGKTKLAGIIGWPLDHTLSPAMHNAAYAAMGLDWTYVPLPVKDEIGLRRVVAALRELPVVGFNVTMPYKTAVMELCDEVATFASLAGAVNTVHVVDGRLVGYSTDGRGLLESLAEETGFEPAGANVVLLGAGGAAGAALAAFVMSRAATVTIANRNLSKAEVLVDRVEPQSRGTQVQALPLAGAEAAVRAADLIVNATPVGMQPGDETPVPVSWLDSHHVIADMVYGREPTPLVTQAREKGARAVDGLGMLVSQGATAIDIWHGSAVEARAPRDVMRAAAQAALRQGTTSTT